MWWNRAPACGASLPAGLFIGSGQFPSADWKVHPACLPAIRPAPKAECIGLPIKIAGFKASETIGLKLEIFKEYLQAVSK